MVSFYKYQKVVFHTMGATLYGNCHSLTVRLPNILLLIKHMIEGLLFYEEFGRIEIRNNIQVSAFSDLFVEDKIYLSIDIELARYVSSVYRNWDNYNLNKSNNYNITPGVKDNNYIGEGLLDNLYKLYIIYN